MITFGIVHGDISCRVCAQFPDPIENTVLDFEHHKIRNYEIGFKINTTEGKQRDGEVDAGVWGQDPGTRKVHMIR